VPGFGPPEGDNDLRVNKSVDTAALFRGQPLSTRRGEATAPPAQRNRPSGNALLTERTARRVVVYLERLTETLTAATDVNSRAYRSTPLPSASKSSHT